MSLLLVTAKKYNNSKDVKFVMKSDDFRLHDSEMKKNYQILDTVEVTREKVTPKGYLFPGHVGVTSKGKSFVRFSDWSVVML